MPFLGVGLAYAQFQHFTLNEMEDIYIKDDAFQEDAYKISKELVDLNEAIRNLSNHTEASYQLVSYIHEKCL